MAIVQLRGCTGSTVAEIGSRADEVECLDRFEAVLGEARSQSLNDSRKKDPVACAHKTTATAIFKPVSHAWQPRAGLQWRKADQPTEMA